MRNKYLLFLTGIMAMLMSSCSSKMEISTTEKIAQNWTIKNATWNGATVATDSTDYINLSIQRRKKVSTSAKSYISLEPYTINTFEWKIDGKLHEKGNWRIKDDSLLFELTPKDKISAIDSINFKYIDGKRYFDLFQNGQLITTYSEDGAETQKSIIAYALHMESPSEATLTNANSTITLHREIDSYDSGISLLSILRGILGLIVLVFIAYLFSADRKNIDWMVVGKGLSAQIVFAIGILKVPFVASFFESLSKFFVLILDFTREGSEFLLGGLLDINTFGFIFLFQVLPTIIFFSALTSVLFYLGIIQKIVYGLAWVMTKFMKLSGAESLSVSGNIFLGQTEAPLMIKAYLPKMNNSEILLVMIGGMATIAGGVLAAYISFLGGDDPFLRLQFAKHLLAASIMAAPGAVVMSKILVPQTEAIDKNIEITQDKIGSNILDAIANGTTEGLKLAANVAAMLLVFVAFIAMINYILQGWLGDITGLNGYIATLTHGQYDGFSLQFILGYLFSPLMWLIGVNAHDMTLAGQLLGEKLIMSEFIAYISLADMKDAAAFVSDKSLIMSTYMLCGFANFASIGIQIGGIGVLAPTKRTLLAKYGIKALIGGSLASLLSATIVGMLMG